MDRVGPPAGLGEPRLPPFRPHQRSQMGPDVVIEGEVLRYRVVPPSRLAFAVGMGWSLLICSSSLTLIYHLGGPQTRGIWILLASVVPTLSALPMLVMSGLNRLESRKGPMLVADSARRLVELPRDRVTLSFDAIAGLLLAPGRVGGMGDDLEVGLWLVLADRPAEGALVPVLIEDDEGHAEELAEALAARLGRPIWRAGGGG